jgi:hypothetical protein
MKKLILPFFISLFFHFNSAFTYSNRVENFIFAGGNTAKEYEELLKNDKISGIQVLYSWKELEPQKNKYDFKRIQEDLEFAKSLNKKLWIQIQDRFFDKNNKFVPDYILEDKEYEGGLAPQVSTYKNKTVVEGWTAKQWNVNVQNRHHKLLHALAEKFDGQVYGINLPETAIDINIKKEKRRGFSCDKYFEATLGNINFTRSLFKKSYVVQNINFWPCEWENDHKYMSRFFENAIKNKIGLGGPDIVPYRKQQMKNTYPFFNKYKNKLPMIAFAVQEPTREYINPQTNKKFTNEEFEKFGIEYLGANIIFWSVEDPKIGKIKWK